jgi:hypothetical protein
VNRDAADLIHYHDDICIHSFRSLSQQVLSMIYTRNKVPDGTIKMSDTEEHSLQSTTETINITRVNVDKMHFKNLLIYSASV